MCHVPRQRWARLCTDLPQQCLQLVVRLFILRRLFHAGMRLHSALEHLGSSSKQKLSLIRKAKECDINKHRYI